MELHYKNKEAEVTRRRAEPIGLVFYAFSWHLISWCQMRAEHRDIKVARILKVKVTEDAFTISKHIQLADYLKQLPVAY